MGLHRRKAFRKTLLRDPPSGPVAVRVFSNGPLAM